MGGSILQLDFEVNFTKRTRSHLGVDKHSAGHWKSSTNRHLRAIEDLNVLICIKTSMAFSITRITKPA